MKKDCFSCKNNPSLSFVWLRAFNEIVTCYMGYTIQALLGNEDLLSKASSENTRVVTLSQGFGLIPFDEHLREVYDLAPFYLVSSDGGIPEFIQQLAIGLSKHGCVAYIEADFFGGVGSQASMVWCQEEKTEGPWVVDNAINLALRRLGVEKGGFIDRFEALGLGRHRSTDDWIQ